MKFLLVYDTEGWAFHRWATGVCEYHGTDHEVCAVSHKDFGQNSSDHDWLRQWDATLFFSWYEAQPLWGMKKVMAMVAHHGYQYPYTQNPWEIMRDWNLLAATRTRNRSVAESKLHRFDGLLAANRIILRDLKDRGFESFYTPGGVDNELFHPQSRLENSKLRVGWCAQHDESRPNNKGWEVLKHIRERLADRKDIEFVVNCSDHRGRVVPPEEMPAWYQSLDVFLVTSFNEGTPLTAQEAMACGVPVIGTNVGILPELIEHHTNGLMVPACRDEESLHKTVNWISAFVVQMADDRSIARNMGSAARASIEESWTWPDRAQDYIAALEAVCNGH